MKRFDGIAVSKNELKVIIWGQMHYKQIIDTYSTMFIWIDFEEIWFQITEWFTFNNILIICTKGK